MNSIFDTIQQKLEFKCSQIVAELMLVPNLFETSMYANSINQSDGIPKTLIDMGEYSENIYDFTKAADRRMQKQSLFN